MENKCENLSLYIIDGLSEHEKRQFEHHLKTCNDCKNEVHSLSEAWQLLSYDIEETDVPTSLKADVMNFIFEEKETPIQSQAVEDKNHSFLKQLNRIMTKQFSPLSISITAILVLSLIGLLWNNLQLKNTITVLENKAVSPTQIIRTMDLKGQDAATSANGIAYLIKEGSNTNLVISLSNMPGTKNDEVYQVWLLKNGNRQNAGTLKPDQNGSGLLTYALSKDDSFDDIGITLEPNPDNTQPQGQKVMGTS